MAFLTSGSATVNVSGQVESVQEKKTPILIDISTAVTITTTMYTVPAQKRAVVVGASLSLRMTTTAYAAIQINGKNILTAYVDAINTTTNNALSWDYATAPIANAGEIIRAAALSGSGAMISAVQYILEDV